MIYLYIYLGIGVLFSLTAVIGTIYLKKEFDVTLILGAIIAPILWFPSLIYVLYNRNE